MKVILALLVSALMMSSFTAYNVHVEDFKNGEVTTHFAYFLNGNIRKGYFEPFTLFIGERPISSFTEFLSIYSILDVNGVMDYMLKGRYNSSDGTFDFGFIVNSHNYGYMEIRGSNEKSIFFYFTDQVVKTGNISSSNGNFRIDFIYDGSKITYYLELISDDGKSLVMSYNTTMRSVKKITLWSGVYGLTEKMYSNIKITEVIYSSFTGETEYVKEDMGTQVILMILLFTGIVVSIATIMKYRRWENERG